MIHFGGKGRLVVGAVLSGIILIGCATIEPSPPLPPGFNYAGLEFTPTSISTSRYSGKRRYGPALEADFYHQARIVTVLEFSNDSPDIQLNAKMYQFPDGTTSEQMRNWFYNNYPNVEWGIEDRRDEIPYTDAGVPEQVLDLNDYVKIIKIRPTTLPTSKSVDGYFYKKFSANYMFALDSPFSGRLGGVSVFVQVPGLE